MTVENSKIAIALSGGVDSAVAAMILKNKGYQLVGLFLKLWSDPTSPKGLRGAGPTSLDEPQAAGPTSLDEPQAAGPTCRLENRCCDYEALEDARSVAAKLDIPFYVVDAKDEFKKVVVQYFIDEYKALRTPNPCVVCNEKIKFDLLLNKALSLGCDYLATGHYAIISPNCDSKFKSNSNGNCYSLLSGVDKTKDQSYNLYRLSQDQLSHVIFPLGEMTKKEVREMARKCDLPVKEKPESQEICFFSDKDYRDFLRRYLPTDYFKAGDIVDAAGNLIGRHEGLINYTVGQRRNINQTQSVIKRNEQPQQTKKPLYVIGFNMQKNQLIVGMDDDVYAKEMVLSNLHWIDKQAISKQQSEIVLQCKIRSQAEKVGCRIKNSESKIMQETVKVIFDQPQRAITPGQSAVFYSGDEVIGGGTIIK